LLKALHNNSTARNASGNQCQLPVLLPVARGASVVLTANRWPQAKLVNGSRGTVSYIVFEEGRGPEDGLSAFVIVTFPSYTGPPFIRLHPLRGGSTRMATKWPTRWVKRRTKS
jgi:hypothetical protein